MTFTQRFLAAVQPNAWAEEMKTESQNWMLQCTCGYERSFWKMGGIRWKAAGNPNKVMRCPHCGQVTQHRVYYKQS
jgi:hypothetical protein